MKILVYTPTFYPKIGGMETVSEYLSTLLVKNGHDVKLLTPINYSRKDTFSFPIYRKPSLLHKIKLVLWADIVYSNGATLALLLLSKIFFKPFVWTHAGYQASCIDGLGWVDGEAAPTNPLGSIKFHLKKSGIRYTLWGAFKLVIRRIAAKYLVNMNVAITDWVATKQPFSRQVKIYNPSPLYKFSNPSKEIQEGYNFLYMGRLVSEKGVKTLLQAFALLVKKFPEKLLKLLIIGDGDIRGELEKMTADLGIQKQVSFIGKKSGQELTDAVHLAPIAIVPSEWEEPMGIVALELMASGRNIIVSEKGGLKECVGEAGLTFPNGDHNMLSQCMEMLLSNPELCRKKKEMAQKQLKKFNPDQIAGQYISLFRKLTNKE